MDDLFLAILASPILPDDVNITLIPVGGFIGGFLGYLLRQIRGLDGRQDVFPIGWVVWGALIGTGAWLVSTVGSILI